MDFQRTSIIPTPIEAGPARRKFEVDAELARIQAEWDSAQKAVKAARKRNYRVGETRPSSAAKLPGSTKPSPGSNSTNNLPAGPASIPKPITRAPALLQRRCF